MNKLIIGILILQIITFSHADKTSPIPINPVLTSFDSLPAIQNLNLYINNVELADSEKDQTLGFTRTSRKTKAPIVCTPSLDTVIKLSISKYLDAKKMSISDMSVANFIINIFVLNADLSEITSGLTQTMTATLKIRASLTDPNDSSNTKTFVIESQNAKKTFDTTKSAEAIFREVISGVLKELVKSITP